MYNLMTNGDAAEKVYFKDRLSRFLFVSKGWLEAAAPGRTEDEVVGKTDFDFFSEEHAAAAFDDEQYIIRTGEPIVGKLERETFNDRVGAWVSTTKMPLRDHLGEVIGTFGISRDVTAQVRAETALAYQAMHDPVTGLANRAAFMDRLSQALVAIGRQPGRLAVIYVDLDHFKEINDSFGHDAGDQVLAEAGRRLSVLCRHGDSVARLGGDELVVLCGALGDDDDVGRIAHRIVRGIAAPYLEDGRDLSVTASAGVVVTVDPLAEPEQLVREADEAMYQAKRAGRNRYHVRDAPNGTTNGRGHLQAELSHAIDASELFLAYQPLFSLEDHSLSGVEALVRWRRPERGLVVPNDFVPFAEEHGLIARIGAFVLDEACRQLAEWMARPGWPEHFTMAVNVSGRELGGLELAERVADVVRRYGIEPTRLCLEITETALVGEWGDVQGTLAALSRLGVRLALDDFGTGYSTLAHLQRLKVDVLKIDRSFVAQMGREPRDREIVAAVTAMAHALGMTVVAEGIETNHQLEALTGLDCNQGQGFLFAPPLSPEGVVALVG
ncbi:MAG TPA: EAL domain-containing protein [Acidimicrobiales bacterium]|nr:EAL domain-containing protein [Acidimicrobiales bacterium]